MQNWSLYRTISDQPGNLRDALHTAIGMEYTPKPNSTRYRDLITYRAGFQYNTLPYQVDGTQLTDINGSLGGSIPGGCLLRKPCQLRRYWRAARRTRRHTNS